MPRFFFDLVTPSRWEIDDLGSDCADVEAAYLEARRAAIEIASELARQGQGSKGYRFEIRDADRRLLFELSFREVLDAPTAPKPFASRALLLKLDANIRRSRRLRGELDAAFGVARARLATTQRLLRSGKAAPPPPGES